MTYPVIYLDGPDGTGKTTQALILGYFLQKLNIPVAYFSYPVYEFPIGRVIGRCLGRWGNEEKIALPTPEDMACLFALNRLETLEDLRRQSWRLTILNRGPYSNLFSVARSVLEKGIYWDGLSTAQKAELVDEMLIYDEEFLDVLQKGHSELVKIFLLMNPRESMELSAGRARSTLGTEPDEYERKETLQGLTLQIFREIADGKIEGHNAFLVEAVKGSLRRAWETPEAMEKITEYEGIKETAQRISQIIFPHLRLELRRIESPEDFWRSYQYKIVGAGLQAWQLAAEGKLVGFDFLNAYRDPDDGRRYPDLWEQRPDLLEQVKEFHPGVMESIKASGELDYQRGLGPERR